MGKSSRTGRRNGTVTVIETRVHRNSARNARLAFVLAAIFIGGIATVAASQWTEPILSLLIGIALGVIVGAICWTAVRVWPVVRVIWWWLGELLASAVITVVWSLLATHTPLAIRASVVAAIIAALLIPNVRRPIVAVGWCFVVRHRLRTCFAQFIVANQSGSLPLILAARPTPVGERVWIYLRPGLSVNELQSRVDKIAVACHASTVIIDRAQQPYCCVCAGRYQTPRRPRRPRRHTPRHDPLHRRSPWRTPSRPTSPHWTSTTSRPPIRLR